MSLKHSTPIRRMTREQLSELLLSPDVSKVAVIDVRDDDYIGGHIHSSIHIPSSSLDHKIPELIRKLANIETVVFHCALSQERGPRAARRYMEEREEKLKSGEIEGSTGPPAIGIKDGIVQKKPTESHNQEVFVLDQGFVGWQEKYGRYDRLTDDYAPDIWTDYY